MASLKRRLEGEIDLRVGGGDAFHDFFENRPHHIANVSSSFVQSCDLHDGAFGTPGSKLFWTYTLDGKAQTVKHNLEVVDKENKVIKFNIIEGDLLNDYKNFDATYQVIPKNEEACTVKWIFEYEKLHPGIPEPTSVMDALIGLAKDIDDHHHREPK